MLVLAGAAAIAIPRVLHLQRVASYTDAIAQTNVAIDKTHRLQVDADHVIVLHSLQLDEARDFQPVLEELSGFTDHYFSDSDLAALAQANEVLTNALDTDALSDEDAETVATATAAIETHGYVWQTAFLNLSPDAVEELIEHSPATQAVPVADEDVTRELVEQAWTELEQAEANLRDAEHTLSAAQQRADDLITAVSNALKPLSSSALGAPDQAEVVLDMYPDADSGVADALRAAARTAADSVSAELFTPGEDYVPVPSAEPEPERGEFAVTDAWRATIIATHLTSYAGGVTAAWITDAGSVEEALGFNPYLPFF